MVRWPSTRRAGPIGVDIGSRSVKLVQFNAERTQLVAASRWDLPPHESDSADHRHARLATALRQAREARDFRGRRAVLCLGAGELFVQNIRVPKLAGEALEKVVRQESAGRLPFQADQSELRYLEVADVRQGDAIRREVIVLACHRPVLDALLAAVEEAGLRPEAVDVEPLALVRCYARQFRRDEDRQQRNLFVHIGATNTAVVVASGEEVLFIKYVEIGGRHFDEAVARNLDMPPAAAAALRLHNGDRRTDQQDPEIARSVAESIRPDVDRLANELSLCVRYHSVTFRGQPLARLVLTGGEASPALVETLNQRLDLRCELGEPLRTFEPGAAPGRKSAWDVAAGLALREV